jgi:hypothetical protein
MIKVREFLRIFHRIVDRWTAVYFELESHLIRHIKQADFVVGWWWVTSSLILKALAEVKYGVSLSRRKICVRMSLLIKDGQCGFVLSTMA